MTPGVRGQGDIGYTVRGTWLEAHAREDRCRGRPKDESAGVFSLLDLRSFLRNASIQHTRRKGWGIYVDWGAQSRQEGRGLNDIKEEEAHNLVSESGYVCLRLQAFWAVSRQLLRGTVGPTVGRRDPVGYREGSNSGAKHMMTATVRGLGSM